MKTKELLTNEIMKANKRYVLEIKASEKPQYVIVYCVRKLLVDKVKQFSLIYSCDKGTKSQINFKLK